MSHYFPHSHKKDKNSKQNHVLDVLIYPVAIISPVMTIPQLVDVWTHKTVVSVSLVTWASYAFVSAFWFLYGIHHKEKPVIMSGGLLCVLDAAIVLGVLINR